MTINSDCSSEMSRTAAAYEKEKMEAEKMKAKEDLDLPLSKKPKPRPNYKELTPIVWRNVLIMGLLHLGFLHGFIMCFFCNYRTILLGLFYSFVYQLFHQISHQLQITYPRNRTINIIITSLN